MDSENVQYKINKYTTKLRTTRSNDKANYYQRKLHEYHQINQYGGIVESPVNSLSDIRTIRIKLNRAIDSCKDDPKLFGELSKIITDSNDKITRLSGGRAANVSHPSENLLNTVQQFFERSENLKDVTQHTISEQGQIHNMHSSEDVAKQWKVMDFE